MEKIIKIDDFISVEKIHTGVLSLNHFLFLSQMSRAKFMEIDDFKKEMIRYKIESNILSDIRIKNPKEFLNNLNDQFTSINMVSDNTIKIMFVE